ncbi:MAG: carbon storage regulator [Pirellulaceae bacterium]|nr:carbon storage regulator [Pirellulaceae bacterium]
MLVLTRKLQEKIHIGDNVTITIVRIQGNTVRVGIEAPQDVRVVRGEISATQPTDVEAAESAVANGAVSSGSESVVALEGVHRFPGRALAGRVRRRPEVRRTPRSEGTALNAI